MTVPPQSSIFPEGHDGPGVLLALGMWVAPERQHRLPISEPEVVGRLRTLHDDHVLDDGTSVLLSFGLESNATALPREQVDVASGIPIFRVRCFVTFPRRYVVVTIEVPGVTLLRERTGIG